jgi:ParB-like chromosome segregation protein Spo0J
MSLRINPEYEKLLPKMTDEEFAQLKASIQEEGQHYPIVANEDLEVLDGHHRFRACMELGIEPDFEVRKFNDELVEKRFVIEANLRRRHLTNFQLVELAVPLLEIEKEIAKKRKVEAGKWGAIFSWG